MVHMTGAAVFVDSRGGNTRKLADAIASELGVSVGDMTAPVPADAGILFLGSGTYGSRPGEAMQKFLRDADLSGRSVALFGTSGSAPGAEKMIAVMAEAVTQKGGSVKGSFHCRGRMFLVNWGHPDKADLEAAGEFARRMAGGA